jgi:hypothetical protein
MYSDRRFMVGYPGNPADVDDERALVAYRALQAACVLLLAAWAILAG